MAQITVTTKIVQTLKQNENNNKHKQKQHLKQNFEIVENEKHAQTCKITKQASNKEQQTWIDTLKS